MRGQRTADDHQADTRQRTPSAAPAPRPRPAGGGGPGPGSLLALQRSAGNAAVVQALHSGSSSSSSSTAVANTADVSGGGGGGTDTALTPVTLPPYLLNLEAPGLSTTLLRSGQDSVRQVIKDRVGHEGGTVAAIVKELTGRPDSFFGPGRSFTVEGVKGSKKSYDVTVSIGPHPDEQAIHAELPADGADLGKATKMDAHRLSNRATGSGTGDSRSAGVGGMVFVLFPAAGPLWAGFAVSGGTQLWQSSKEYRRLKTTTKGRVLRSDSGSVHVPRLVRFAVRVAAHDGDGPTYDRCDGELDQKVPTEQLVPPGAAPNPRPKALGTRAAGRVKAADSLAAVAAVDPAESHEGGGGLFDKVASVLHPAITAPGSPGRAALYSATAPATVAEDLPRMLGDGVFSEDMPSKDPHTTGAYRMRAEITQLAPAWAGGKTALRAFDHTQDSATSNQSKGRNLSGGVGPALGLGPTGQVAVLRTTAMLLAGLRKQHFSGHEQTAATRRGAEIKGQKVLYLAAVNLTAEGTGTRTADMILAKKSRVATHKMYMWLTLRADEAAALGLELPPDVEVKKPFPRDAKQAAKRKAAEQARGKGKGKAALTTVPEEEELLDYAPEEGQTEEEARAERHLVHGAAGANVVLTGLDTGPLLTRLQSEFAEGRLKGYLPAFGDDKKAAYATKEEAELQRQNYRDLVEKLSQENLSANKEQLLSSGIRVPMRRKGTLHDYDVEVQVTGSVGKTSYDGDIDDWLVRSHSGVSGSGLSGRSSSRTIGYSLVGQLRVVPAVLTLGARRDKQHISSRRNQAGPVTRTDVLTNGNEKTEAASAFTAPLTLSVRIRTATLQNKYGRATSFGSFGRDDPDTEELPGFSLDQQDVRLYTPRAFTMDDEQKQAFDAAGAGERPAPVHRDLTAGGIGDLVRLAPEPAGGGGVKEWTLVESVGDGAAVRDLAFDLLAKAAARNEKTRDASGAKTDRKDTALAAEGLAPRRTIEDRFSANSISAALRQAVSSGWVVQDLHHARRLADLQGAVGTRLGLANAKVVHEGKGAGTETFVMGGHQATGQQGKGTSTMYQGGVTGVEQGTDWRLAQGVSGSRTTSQGDSGARTVSGTIERNSHTSRDQQLYLVRADLLVNMVAEVKVTFGGPYVSSAGRTLPGEALVWMTAQQLRTAGIELPASARAELKLPAGSAGGDKDGTGGTGARLKRTGKQRAGESSGDAGARASGFTPPTDHTLARDLPLGLGMFGNVPDFLPLLDDVRGRLSRIDQDLAEELLPTQLLKDPFDNVLRLAQVLGRDGAAGLMSSAMDGGVTVPLYNGRKTPYWAVFSVHRKGDGRSAGLAGDGRDMEHISSAVAQDSDAHEESKGYAAEGVFAGSAKPEDGAGPVRSVGPATGPGVASAGQRRDGTSSRSQAGMKVVGHGSSRMVKMVLPIDAKLEIFPAGAAAPLTTAPLGYHEMEFRAPAADLEAMRKVERVSFVLERDDSVDTAQESWHARGVRLPLAAQVNGFKGAPQARQLVLNAVKAAGGGDRYRDKGQNAAYTLQEAVSTEWLASALPLLAASGAELPPVHASGAQGQDLRAWVHARLRAGRVLGTSDAKEEFTFESIAPSGPGEMRHTQSDEQHAGDQSSTLRGVLGPTLVSPEARINQGTLNYDSTDGSADMSASGSGSLPVLKPKARSTLVQFTVDLRVVAEVTDRGTHRVKKAARDMTLPMPVVIRMPAPEVERMIGPDNGFGSELRGPAENDVRRKGVKGKGRALA
ncbi:hypothetical protein AB0G32_00725 [Streptomyces sp. NPDC023723]|uniref:hypothetical protein n=1 Tax=Streptomyces sp. NPDC023723 TaxID=3154323 RepID=UPI00340A7367